MHIGMLIRRLEVGLLGSSGLALPHLALLKVDQALTADEQNGLKGMRRKRSIVIEYIIQEGLDVHCGPWTRHEL